MHSVEIADRHHAAGRHTPETVETFEHLHHSNGSNLARR